MSASVSKCILYSLKLGLICHPYYLCWHPEPASCFHFSSKVDYLMLKHTALSCDLLINRWTPSKSSCRPFELLETGQCTSHSWGQSQQHTLSNQIKVAWSLTLFKQKLSHHVILWEKWHNYPNILAMPINCVFKKKHLMVWPWRKVLPVSNPIYSMVVARLAPWVYNL